VVNGFLLNRKERRERKEERNTVRELPLRSVAVNESVFVLLQPLFFSAFFALFAVK